MNIHLDLDVYGPKFLHHFVAKIWFQVSVFPAFASLQTGSSTGVRT